ELQDPRSVIGGDGARDGHLVERVVIELGGRRRRDAGLHAAPPGSNANVASPTEYFIPWYWSNVPGAFPVRPARKNSGRPSASGAASPESGGSMEAISSVRPLVTRSIISLSNFAPGA